MIPSPPGHDLDKTALKSYGAEGFQRLVATFYRHIRLDDVIGSMYNGDFDGGEYRLCQFLLMRYGFENKYNEQRGHPRLRMRHSPFPIGPTARDRWLSLMARSMKETQMPESLRLFVIQDFTQIAHGMQNRSQDE